MCTNRQKTKVTSKKNLLCLHTGLYKVKINSSLVQPKSKESPRVVIRESSCLLKMATQADLRKIGREGFGILEPILEKRRNTSQSGGENMAKRVPMEEVMDSNQAAKLLQGVSITDYRLSRKGSQKAR